MPDQIAKSGKMSDNDSDEENSTFMTKQEVVSTRVHTFYGRLEVQKLVHGFPCHVIKLFLN